MRGSGFADKLLSATGATDVDLSLMPGDTDTLSAMGATEVFVIPILQPGPEIQPFLVFCLPAGDVSGKHSEESKGYHSTVQEGKKPIQEGTANNDI